jgi:hypothetical protein
VVVDRLFGRYQKLKELEILLSKLEKCPPSKMASNLIAATKGVLSEDDQHLSKAGKDLIRLKCRAQLDALCECMQRAAALTRFVLALTAELKNLSKGLTGGELDAHHRRLHKLGEEFSVFVTTEIFGLWGDYDLFDTSGQTKDELG